MVRKGELNKGLIDRGWPHQVSLIAEATHGDNYVRMRLFCEPLSLCTRGHSFTRDDQWFNVWCFAELDHAEKFQAKFGGEIIALKDRPRWPGTATSRRQ